jgi:hypothetical protein
VWVTFPSSTPGLPHTARLLRRLTGAPLPGGMQTKRPSTAGTEQAATGSRPSQWRPAAALVGPDVSSRASQHSNGTFTREQFVSGVLRELSVCLCRRNAAMKRAVASCFVRVSVGCYSPGLDQPTVKVS